MEDPAFDLFCGRLAELLYGTGGSSHYPSATSLKAHQLKELTFMWAVTHSTAKKLWTAEATRTVSFKTYENNHSSIDCDLLTPFILWRDAQLSLASTNGDAVGGIAKFEGEMRELWDNDVVPGMKGYWAAKVRDFRRDAFSREIAKKLLKERSVLMTPATSRGTAHTNLPVPLYDDPYNANRGMHFPQTSGSASQVPPTVASTQFRPVWRERGEASSSLLRILDVEPEPEIPFTSDWAAINSAAPHLSSLTSQPQPLKRDAPNASEQAKEKASGVGAWECPVTDCMLTFGSSVDLMNHLKDHEDPRPYTVVPEKRQV